MTPEEEAEADAAERHHEATGEWPARLAGPATIYLDGKPITQALDLRFEEIRERAKETILPALEPFRVAFTVTLKPSREFQRFVDSISVPRTDKRRVGRERRHFLRPPTRGYWAGCKCRGCAARRAVDAVPRPADMAREEALSRLAVGLPLTA